MSSRRTGKRPREKGAIGTSDDRVGLLRFGRDQAPFGGNAHGIAALADADLAKNRLQPIFHRVGRHTDQPGDLLRSEEHTSELQSLMRSSYAVFCLKNKQLNST